MNSFRYTSIMLGLLLFFGLLSTSFMIPKMMLAQEKDDRGMTPLLRFGEAGNARWQIVNDGVMGGLSRGQLRSAGAAHSVFEGLVSLANNGGFTSMVTRTSPLDFSAYSGLRISAKGCTPRFAEAAEDDSYNAPKTYALRLKIATANGRSRFSYATRFTVPPPQTGAEMQHFDIPLRSEAFTPVFRGRELSDVPGLDVQRMQITEIGFMISDKQDGSFCLALGGVSLY